MDKAKPQDIELEKLVLGAILLESDSMNSVIGLISNDNIFYSDRNKKVWSAMRMLFNESTAIDSVTVFEKLQKIHPKVAKDLAIYISQLCNGIGSAANIEIHATYLKELYVKRRIIEIGLVATNDGFDDSKDAFDVYDSIITQLDTLNSEVSRTQHVTFYEVVNEKITALKHAAENGNYKTGIISYLNDLDRMTLGFQPQDLIIIAGRPSMGKTALAVDIARKQAKELQIPVALFSLEMSTSQLTDRILSSETRIPLENIRKGGLKFNEWQVLDRAKSEVENYQLHICDKGGLTINEICSTAKNWHLKYGIQIIYIDYMQLITNPDKQGKNGNREQEISSISRRLKQLAKELNVPVICLSQLSRQCEARADKRPMLSDLRESGAIEQDADMVIFPYRDEYYNESAEKGLCELIIAKNRNGKTGIVTAYFNGDCQLFTNSLQSYDND